MANTSNTSITFVSCYYPVTNKHKSEDFHKWFKNTLSIHAPYVFFAPKEVIPLIRSFRKELPTHYIEYNLSDFYTQKYRYKMITHPTHCPSVDLNLIWNEKIYMIQKASEINPFNSDWFHWVDAGLCVYRTEAPPVTGVNTTALQYLPTNKFVYSQSLPFSASRITNTNYYHHVSGTYIIHKQLIESYVALYTQYMDTLVDTRNIWTDQVIHTHILRDHPEMFFKLCDGYGTITKFLFNIT